MFLINFKCNINITKITSKDDEPPELLNEVNSEYTYEIFTCVAIIMLKRQDLLACQDCTDVLTVAQCACRQLGLERVHRKTYNLYQKYLWLKARQYIEKESSNNVFDKMTKALKSKLKIKSTSWYEVVWDLSFNSGSLTTVRCFYESAYLQINDNYDETLRV